MGRWHNEAHPSGVPGECDPVELSAALTAAGGPGERTGKVAPGGGDSEVSKVCLPAGKGAPGEKGFFRVNFLGGLGAGGGSVRHLGGDKKGASLKQKTNSRRKGRKLNFPTRLSPKVWKVLSLLTGKGKDSFEEEPRSTFFGADVRGGPTPGRRVHLRGGDYYGGGGQRCPEESAREPPLYGCRLDCKKKNRAAAWRKAPAAAGCKGSTGNTVLLGGNDP